MLKSAIPKRSAEAGDAAASTADDGAVECEGCETDESSEDEDQGE